jgi:Flp pilus assembly protein TadB
MSNILKAALDGLNRKIHAGADFPDALHRILLTFPEVTQEELTEAYDQQAFSQFLLAGMSKPLVKHQGEPT